MAEATDLTLHGAGNVVTLFAGIATIADYSSGLTLGVAANTVTNITGFVPGSGSIVDLLGVTGFDSAQAPFMALQSDGKGGAMLAFGDGGRIDFLGSSVASFHAGNFTFRSLA